MPRRLWVPLAMTSLRPLRRMCANFSAFAASSPRKYFLVAGHVIRGRSSAPAVHVDDDHSGLAARLLINAFAVRMSRRSAVLFGSGAKAEHATGICPHERA